MRSISSICRCRRSPKRPTAARMRCWCGCGPAAIPAGANARPRRWSRSPPWSARCRMAPAAASAQSVLGERLEEPADIARIAAPDQLDSMDLLQAPHTLSGHRDGAVGPARQGAERAGLAAARLSAGLREIALCLAAFRRRAAGDPGTGRAAADGRLPRREVRLGAVRQRRARRRRRPVSMAAREGIGPDGNAAGRCRPDLRGGCGGRRAPAAGARGGRRIMARGALRRPCAGSACLARRRLAEGRPGRRGSGP